MKNLLIAMWHQQRLLIFIVYFLQYYQVSYSIGLTIDNQLIVIANDCYTRVAIGFKLSDIDIFSNIAVASISECEDECSKKRNSCNSFAFGIGIKGNGTCALSRKLPKAEELQPHADYDIYVRSQRSPHCESDQLYKMGSDIGQKKGNETRPITRFGSGFLNPTLPTMPSTLSSPRTVANVMSNAVNNPSYLQEYMSSFDDERRISDILRNRNPTAPASNPFGTNNGKVDNYNDAEPAIYSNRKSIFGQKINTDPHFGYSGFGEPSFRDSFTGITRFNFAPHFNNDVNTYKGFVPNHGPFEIFSRPISVHDGTLKTNKPPLDFSFWNNQYPMKHQNTFANHLNQYRGQEFLNNAYKNQGIITKPKQNDLITGSYDSGKTFRPIIGNTYSFETNGIKNSNREFKDSSEIWNPGLLNAFRGFGAKITEKSKSCYRRLLSGKKSLEPYIRRAIECEKIEDCHRACDYEKRFTCEGFNYKRIGHGTRGLCEMTSIPYSRMDIHRDFVSDPQCDYYEKDPNCLVKTSGTQPWWNTEPRPSQSYLPSYSSHRRPDTRPYIPDRRPLNEVPRPLDYDRRPISEIPRPLDYDRGPFPIYGSPPRHYDNTFEHRDYSRDQDSIRDGYQITRPEDRFNYDSRFQHKQPADDYYNSNLPWTQYPKYPDRRIDHGPTQDIGANEINSYLPQHRKNSNRVWDTYDSVYGSSYGYDTNYIGKFDVPKYHSQSESKPLYDENDRFYSKFYKYGGAFGHGDNYIPADQDSLYGGIGKIDECSVRAGAGFRLSRTVVRKTYLTPNLEQCDSLCISEKSFICMGFSYRYNVAPTDPTDNCLLSDISYKDLNFYTDLEPDRDYDVYAIIISPGTCSTQRKPTQHPPDECFWRVRSGFGMPEDVIRKSIIVDNLGQCQVECAETQDFTCRSFAFKYGLQGTGQDTSTNCFLSDWPSQDINPVNMPDMDGAELYEKGSFGRGCEPYSTPFINIQFNGKQSVRGEACYSGYNRPCKLTPYAVLLATYVNSEQDCRQKCSKMRENGSTPCMSYSYKLTTHGTEENCLLSDVSVRDLRPGLDYTYDDDHVLYTWKDLDPHCFSQPSDFNSEENYPGIRPDDINPPPSFAIQKPDYNDRPHDPNKPGPIGPYPDAGDYMNTFEFSGPNRGLGFLQPNEYQTFQHYTVNGYPCKRGTRCERNKIAGFWSCETEGSEFGGWDYCCEPTHHCGFSQGYHYQWCYVGVSEDQWRPCSDKYFPYLPSPRPLQPRRPLILPGEGHHCPYPNYCSRHWPVTYLHKEPPPNCTDSLASANNNENRRLNETILSSSSTTLRPNSTTEIANNTSTKIRRRRLQSRLALANNVLNDRVIISRRKEITVNRVQNHKYPERIGEISSIMSVPAQSFSAVTTIAPPVTNNGTINLNGLRAINGAADRFEHMEMKKETMIRVPLIIPNNSLSARA